MVHVHPISLYVLESPFPLWVIQGPQTSSLPGLTVRTEVPAIGKACARAAEAVPPKWVSAHGDQLLDEKWPVEHQAGKDPGMSVLDHIKVSARPRVQSPLIYIS